MKLAGQVTTLKSIDIHILKMLATLLIKSQLKLNFKTNKRVNTEPTWNSQPFSQLDKVWKKHEVDEVKE